MEELRRPWRPDLAGDEEEQQWTGAAPAEGLGATMEHAWGGAGEREELLQFACSGTGGAISEEKRGEVRSGAALLLRP